MTLFSLRAGVALLLAASLASCGGGGGKATFPVAGSVTGLVYGPLVLKAGSQTVNVNPVTPSSPDTVSIASYAFPQTIEYGTPYLVELGTNPPHQSCSVLQDKPDSAGHTATINITVNCSVNSFTINGYVTGLTGENLQLINGSTNGILAVTTANVNAAATTEAAAVAAAVAAGKDASTAAKTPSFTFPVAFYNQAYGVTILKQPDGQTCTVTNGNGLVGDAPVVNIMVKCVAKPAT